MKVSVQELLIVLLIVIVVFGPTQLPKLSQSLGQSIRSFRKGMEEDPKADEQTEEK